MMKTVTNGISKYMFMRATKDWVNEDGSLKDQISGLKRWLAHILLTTNINIGCATEDQNPVRDYDAPANHFYNAELATTTLNKTGIFVRCR